MADERMTEVRVERNREDDDGRGETSITYVVQVPPSVDRDATTRDLLERVYDHVALPSGSHPDVADSGPARWSDGLMVDGEWAPRGSTRFEEMLDAARPPVSDSGGGPAFHTAYALARASDPVVALDKNEEVAEREYQEYDRIVEQRAAQRLHMGIGCRCPGRPNCAPHGAGPYDNGCEAHGYSDGWEPSDEPAKPLAPVEVDELEKDRAEQLVAALALALRLLPAAYTVDESLEVARELLAHPWVRDALEPARAVVWAEPLGTIVSFSYPDSETPVKASHVRVRLDPGVRVSADTIGKKVAVAK